MKGRHEEFGGTPSWAVLLAAVLAVAVSVSLAHPGAASRAHPQQRRFDVLTGLQHLGFFHAARWEQRVTAHVRMVAHTAGGRHSPDYWACAQILFADIPRTHDISVGHEATAGAAEPATTWFVSLLAGWAGSRRIALVLKNDLHPTALRLVREQVADLTAGHLVELLVRLVPVGDAVADIPDVAKGDGLDASLVERRDKSGRVLVRDGPALTIQAA